MNVEEMYQETEMEIVFVNEQNFGKRIKVFVNKRRTNWNVHFLTNEKKQRILIVPERFLIKKTIDFLLNEGFFTN